MFDAVVFDLDGLLLDTESIAIAAGVAACRTLGHEVAPEFFHTLVGIDDTTSAALLSAHLGVALEAEAINAAWDKACAPLFAQGIPLKPGVTELLDLLDVMSLPRAIATSSRRASAQSKLQAAGLADRFTFVVSMDCIASPKPAPDPYLRAAALLDADPARCLAFEDSDTGVRAAVAAGMTVVQVPDMLPPATDHAHFRADTLMDGARACGLLARFA
ncbi:HAD family hydrolase [Actibacterium sp. D379-3]